MAKSLANLKLGCWILREKIGLGGTAEIWRADHLGGGVPAAIKVMHAEKAVQPVHVKSFQGEWELLSQLDHPGVPRVLERGVVDQRPAMAMEYVPGANVSSLLARRTPFPALGVLVQLAGIVDFLHRKRVVHGDLKLENLILNPQSQVKLVDFGTARRRHLLSPVTAIFAKPQARIFGTAAYLAPEIIAGKRSDFPSDLYALGVCAFALCVGRTPFEATRLSAKLRAHANEAAPTLAEMVPGFPPGPSSLIDRCLAKDPRHRPASAAEVEAAGRLIQSQLTQSALHRAIKQADDVFDLDAD